MFLSDLKELNEKDCFEVFVPSIKKKVSFRAFTVKQYKDIINTVLDGIDGTLLTGKILNDAIIENSTTPVDFKLWDRAKVLIDMRCSCISNLIKIGDVEYNLLNLPTFAFNFEQERTLEYKGVTIGLCIPSIATDTKVTEGCLLELGKIAVDDKKAGSSLSTLLTYEIIKFITSVKMGDSIIEFSSSSVLDRKTIVDNLPLKLNNDILEFIADYKSYEQNLFTFSDGAELVIDASFLTGE